jgi:2-dehydropantoate 2-reductase
VDIAVMGAGAVGCYYGGILARAGHAVTLIGRPVHVEAMQRAGLLLETAQFREAVPVRAQTAAEAVAGCAVVLCCVKSTDSEAAAAAMAPHLARDAVVLSLQNGVDNAQRLRAALACTVVPVAVYVGTQMAGPGHVRHHGRGELVLGPWPGAGDFVAALAAAGIPATVSGNIDGVLWGKLVVNCAFNALSAVTRLPYGRLFACDGVPETMRAVVDECLAVAARAGVTVPGDSWEEVRHIARTMPGQFSSTAQDLARGRRSEIDHLNGHVVRRGRELGVPTPVNQALQALVRTIEDTAAR